MERFTASATNTQTVRPQKPSIRVACVGDSITELTQYPHYASQILGAKYLVCNFGACGSTILLDSDSPYLYTAALESAMRFQPNVSVIMLGTNDASVTFEQYRGNFADDYVTLVERFQSLAGKPRIWVVKPPPIFNAALGLSKAAMDKEIIPAIEQAAEKTNVPLIDVYSALDNPSYFLDGVHPNDTGARVIAEVVCKAITSKIMC